MKNNICYLTITEYQLFIGSEHYYGALRCNGEKVEVNHKMSEKEATYLNNKDFKSPRSFYKKGMETMRFATYESVIDKGLKLYKKVFPNAKVLLLGNPAYIEPMEVLSASKEIREKTSLMHLQHCEYMEKYREEGMDEKADKLYKEFKKILEQL